MSEGNLKNLEQALGNLLPAPSGFDRERFMFLAGQAAARRPQRFWPGVSVVLALAVVVLSGVLATRPSRVEIVYVPHAGEAPPRPAAQSSEREEPMLSVPSAGIQVAAPASYLRLRAQLHSDKVTQAAPLPDFYEQCTPTLDQLLVFPTASLDPVSRYRLQRALASSGGSL